MNKKIPIRSSIELTDFANDTIQVFGGFVVSDLRAEEIVDKYPGIAFLDKTTTGVITLCVCRIDGQPFDVEATNSSTSYLPRIRLFGGRRRPRPKNKS